LSEKVAPNFFMSNFSSNEVTRYVGTVKKPMEFQLTKSQDSDLTDQSS
jgi:hypothetical protein